MLTLLLSLLGFVSVAGLLSYSQSTAKAAAQDGPKHTAPLDFIEESDPPAVEEEEETGGEVSHDPDQTEDGATGDDSTTDEVVDTEEPVDTEPSETIDESDPPAAEEEEETGGEVSHDPDQTEDSTEDDSTTEEVADDEADQTDPEENTQEGTTNGNDQGEPQEPAEDIVLPNTPAEIAAFVQAVIAEPEDMIHAPDSDKMADHMAFLNLIPRDEATDIAIGNGSWFDPSNWASGQVPDDDAKVLIPNGVNIIYDDVSDTRLFTVRVDGQLEFATDTDSQMIVDTMAITAEGGLTIGTADNPVADNVNVDIIFANNGPIDVDWDPRLLSRGLIAHGDVNIRGSVKDSHEKVTEDPMAGDTSVKFAELPEGWAVGDKIVIAGTRYDGYKWDNDIKAERFYEPEDEIRIISDISGGRVYFEEPLEFDHDAPRDDLMTSVANYSRNVTFTTEDPETAEVYERAHVMFLHNDDVDVRYAEFNELGRTDKSQPAREVDDFDVIAFDSNVKGRYSLHFHRAGVDDPDDQGIVVGNAVFGSPGWGFVQHDSNAIFDNNASYDTFGAGYVAEGGNETGSWINNIAIFAQGVDWGLPKTLNDPDNMDVGKTGDGFWFQGRMVDSIDNIAASVNTGFVYFTRGSETIPFDAENFLIPDALYLEDGVSINKAPVLSFSGNEVFAARQGLHVVKNNPDQGHDIRSVFEDFLAWSVKSGAEFSYTSSYLIKDFDVIGKDDTPFSEADTGIIFGKNVFDMTIVNATIEGFDIGIDLLKEFVSTSKQAPENFDLTVIDPTFIDVLQSYLNYDPSNDVITSASDLDGQTPDIRLDGPLTYKEGVNDPEARVVEIQGTKADGLGETIFPNGTDSLDLNKKDVVRLLEEDGYYTTNSGDNYFMLDLYFSDRLTGDIFLERHPVYLDDNVPLGNQAYSDAVFNGVKDPDELDLPEMDSAMLWAQLTDGNVVYSEEAILMDQIDDDAIAALTFGM